STEEMVQRGHVFAIVDEVDSILVDEARTPLIISGPIDDRSDLYNTIDALLPELAETDYEVDEKMKTVSLTEAGNEHVEQILAKEGLLKGDSLYDIENVTLVHHINQALRAHKLFQRDKDYIVKDDQVIIIDEFTGRMMEGRRYSEGQHQALEAKEHVSIQPENQTLATVTFQNYFRLYEKLAGMTGTAATEADEFMDIYALDVLEIPTDQDMIRIDDHDEVYRTAAEKYRAIIELIKDCMKRKQPMLVGTTSIEKSEHLADLLRKEKVRDFQVLNARYHEQEATIIAQAGVPGAVTIATNMAGRGTDIQLGGNPDMLIANWIEQRQAEDKPPTQKQIDAQRKKIGADVEKKKKIAIEAGGLYVIGTERHESRRIDNQLRGRSGRQGDPGHSKFYLSLDDDLMRIFGSDRMDGMLQKLGLEEGEAIIHPWINKALEKAQQKVEARNFDARKHILKFDNVMNDQRKVIFEQRRDLMGDVDVSDTITDMRHEVIDSLIAKHIPEKAYAEQWDAAGLAEAVEQTFDLELPIEEWAAEEGIADEQIHERLTRQADEAAARKAASFGPETMRQIEKAVLLQTLDHLWREHLVTLEHLRQVIGLRGYGQRDPLNEFKTEGFSLFEALLVELRLAVTGQLSHVQMEQEEPPQMMEMAALPEMHAHHISPLTGEDDVALDSMGGGASVVGDAPASSWGKVPRNAPCPCGSGKKYKRCHGKFV
ncbi:MAG: preprotein translocase subunit SecA, partial [Proteobacteria bacterium]|nr:preprotein translocase subunit SecA [Pseudomonadota bacterium]